MTIILKLKTPKFISKGDKVKFTVKFKGREMQHTELGKDLMNKIIEETKDIAKVESKPKFRASDGYDYSTSLKINNNRSL